jgi:hypothetical protein
LIAIAIVGVAPAESRLRPVHLLEATFDGVMIARDTIAGSERIGTFPWPGRDADHSP